MSRIKDAIAVVGMACRYPDASSPDELWENSLAGRRAFRRIPRERFRLEDYYSPDPAAADKSYVAMAAVLEGYTFDRTRFHIARSTYDSVDPAHWIALEVAADALADAGWADGEHLPRDRTGVLIGNSLTGDASRAQTMRLRWPYVRRAAHDVLRTLGRSNAEIQSTLAQLEERYKQPFAPITEETLAGGLSNTIAGRICNYFDLHGGGYTVDGACASSLLAIANACSALTARDLDAALAGGVDVSIDPFELVGFSRVGALAAEHMRVFDAHASGFWPGEGCGVVVLMRYEDAIAQNRKIYAVIRGWGVSSDGNGGLTRPELQGQLLALQRAYARADIQSNTVGYFEGHGTGTSVGDTTELQTIRSVLEQHRNGRQPSEELKPVISSIKANIGHTKAAAGVAGFIRAVMAVHSRVLPPLMAIDQPHPELARDDAPFRVLRQPERWRSRCRARSAVSAMGFGGINVHAVLEECRGGRSSSPPQRTLQRLGSSAQDAELFLISARDSKELRERACRLLSLAPQLSFAELADIAVEMSHQVGAEPMRAAVVAGSPSELADRLQRLIDAVDHEVERDWAKRPFIDVAGGVFLGKSQCLPRIGFLFPGQASPVRRTGGALAARFGAVSRFYSRNELPAGDVRATEIAQPAIIAASLSGLLAMRALGLRAHVAVGHSVGELAALHWGGAIDETSVLRLATLRGAVMARCATQGGAMASIAAMRDDVKSLLRETQVVIAAENSPRQTVVSGAAQPVQDVCKRAESCGYHTTLLPVSNAFHSPLMQPAATAFRESLVSSGIAFARLRRESVYSTITGDLLEQDTPLDELLVKQLTSPVRFLQALTAAQRKVDLWIEVGPGDVLAGIVQSMVDVPVIALDAGSEMFRPLLCVSGAAFALGAPLRHHALMKDRFSRPFDVSRDLKFLSNPCDAGDDAAEPEHDDPPALTEIKPIASPTSNGRVEHPAKPVAVPTSALQLVRRLVAEHAELPIESVRSSSRLLADLHLNSIRVAQLVAEAARQVAPGSAPLKGLTEFAKATVQEVAEALEQLRRGAPSGEAQNEPAALLPAGVDTWLRPFAVQWKRCQRPPSAPRPEQQGDWEVIALEDDAFAQRMMQERGSLPRSGVLALLPPEPDERCVPLLLRAAQSAASRERETLLVVVQEHGGSAGFARSVRAELPHVDTLALDIPPEHPQACTWIREEIESASGSTEVRYDTSGARWAPVMCAYWPSRPESQVALGAGDVLLVTGGGKGIAAECALAFAGRTNVKLALLGRSKPEDDAELAASLGRFAGAGVTCEYRSADVTDAQAVAGAIRSFESSLGAITGVLHGAGSNIPQSVRDLTVDACMRTLHPKVDGARNVLASIDPAKLRLFVAFGSIIARTGLRGEADYALANEWLRRLVERFQAERPTCRCLVLEWSVWSGVGMGERLGRIEALAQEGIDAITVDQGVAAFCELVESTHPPDAGCSVIATARIGSGRQLPFFAPEPSLPLLRFVENVRVLYPNVESVTEIDLSPTSDRYVDDHVYEGQRLFPAVMMLEAVAHAARLTCADERLCAFENVQFERAIVVPPDDSPRGIRIAALVRNPKMMDAVIRSDETSFAVDHMRVTCRFDERPARRGEFDLCDCDESWADDSGTDLDVQKDLYGRLLFHTGRFKRIARYDRLHARQCSAIIAAGQSDSWFGRHRPEEMTLGDPAVRDAAIHAIQACIPHRRILPVAVDEIRLAHIDGDYEWHVMAKEREQDGDTYVYDLILRRADNAVEEQWRGLRLRSVEELVAPPSWPGALLEPYLERRAQELCGERICVRMRSHWDASEPTQRSGRTDRLLALSVGAATAIHRRADGRVHLDGQPNVSSSHADTITLVAHGECGLACDAESVLQRKNSQWVDLLGSGGKAIAHELQKWVGCSFDEAATQVWTACECLRKSGRPFDAPLVLDRATGDGWVLFRAGICAVVSYLANVRDVQQPVAITFLTRSLECVTERANYHRGPRRATEEGEKSKSQHVKEST